MRIAFTSCMNLKHYPEQQVWRQIAAEQPDYLFLLGDQIYMDFFPRLGEPGKWSDEKFRSEMEQRYQAQWSESNFQALVHSLRTRQDRDGGVYGTWDDHDFAWNNANGANVPESKKRIARELFSRYMYGSTETPDHIYRAVPLREGSRVVGKAIFLDTRSYRDEPGDDSTLLGREQFGFLRDELGEELPLTIICSGTPMRATGKGWLRYRRDSRAFMDMIGRRKVLFLSGDIHENMFLPPSAGTRMYEIISSGAAVNKYAAIGMRRNYGVLDCSASGVRVKLVDKRGAVSYAIHNNDKFDFEEH